MAMGAATRLLLSSDQVQHTHNSYGNVDGTWTCKDRQYVFVWAGAFHHARYAVNQWQ